MTAPSKLKGNAGERELCKFLSENFDGSFMRVPNSGAAIGGKNSNRKSFLSNGQIRSSKGDIAPPDHMPKFVLECKNYGKFPFHQLMWNSCAQLDTWIKQTIDIIDAEDLWCVAFKVTRIGWFVAIPDRQYITGNHSIYTSKHGTFLVTDLKQFFSDNKNIILELSK